MEPCHRSMDIQFLAWLAGWLGLIRSDRTPGGSLWRCEVRNYRVTVLSYPVVDVWSLWSTIKLELPVGDIWRLVRRPCHKTILPHYQLIKP